MTYTTLLPARMGRLVAETESSISGCLAMNL